MTGLGANGSGTARRWRVLSRPAWGSARQWLYCASSWAAALLLILAATGKAVALARGALQPLLLGLAAPGWTLALVMAETLLAAWLLACWRPGACRTVAAGTFALFAAAGLVQAALGQERCGCFGVVQMPLAIMLPVNLAVAAGLMVGRPSLATSRTPPLTRAAYGAGLALCAVPAVAAVFAAGRYLLSGPGQRSVILTPDGVVGRPAEFLLYVEHGGELARGRWRLLVYRDGCNRCAAALAAWARSAQGESSHRRVRGGSREVSTLRKQAATRVGSPGPGWALGEVEGVRYGVLVLPGSRVPPGVRHTLRTFEASPLVTWYAVAPMVLEVDEGVVGRAEMDMRGTPVEEKGAALRRPPPACPFWFIGFTAAEAGALVPYLAFGGTG
jgi:hypothetical protein